ncbi:MAG: response regulator, partial [Dehalococcoidia bacterium]
MPGVLRVLLVEDSPDDAELIQREIRRGGYDLRCDVVETKTDFGHALEQEAWDVVLCDHNLPSFDSFQALQLLQGTHRPIPFIIVSGAIGEETAVAALKAGAADFVMKGGLRRLVPVIEREIREARAREERRRAREESDRLSAIIEATPDLVATIDAEGLPTYLNEAGCRMLGLSDGQSVEDLRESAPEIAGRLLRRGAFARAAIEGKWSEENVLLTAHGTEVPVSQVTLAHRGRDGEIDFFSVIAHDITQIKASEEALIAADRRKDEFLATLAHELRNPLAPLMNAISLMSSNDVGGDEIEELREIAGRQMAHMVRLIDDLLDVSRISRGKIDLRKEEVPIKSVLDASVEATKPLAESGGYTLTVNSEDEDAVVHGDPARLTQVFTNLLNNAIKYTPGGGDVAVGIQRWNGDVEVSVRDNGVGIAPDMLAKIFGMFVQVDRALKGSQSGLGVGLTLVKSLVEMHNGQVEARSAGLGQGSEFIVRLPLAASGLPGDRKQPRAETANPSLGCRALIVDDTRVAADMFARFLKAKGHDAHAVYSAEEALEVLEDYCPDVVFSDIAMPVMSGYEFAGKLREWPQRSSFLLVAMSGYGQEEDRRKSL